ncbi:hypothetical protein [Candidatus Chloroploca sp. Khr17]|uniref:nSTAND1 domain-containing NTPase n=1 Tax=Candidatus Chloroploca sp. Khr17 TaxID=2496869 RepID=UPI00101CD4C3|nr:hypothetical protein [Candidatus Chloroploca sp. Khr17]
MSLYESVLNTLQAHMSDRPSTEIEQLATQIANRLASQSELATLSKQIVLEKLQPAVQIMLAQDHSSIENAAQYAVQLLVTQVVDDPQSTVPERFRAAQFCPYPGLSAFQEGDHTLFCGRDDDLSVALTFADRTIIPVTGPSGVGKSSFVRAGFIPALRKHWGGQTAIIVHTLDTSNDPIIGLAKTLSLDSVEEEHQEFVAKLLHQDPAALVGILDRLRPPDGHLCFIVDQFEELFVGDEKGRVEERRRFLEALLAVDAQAPRVIHIILATRENFFEHPDYIERPRLVELIQRQNIPLDTLDNDQLRTAIEEPLRRFNQQNEQSLRFQEGLVDLILQTFRRTTGSLPLVQYLLRLLWTEHNHLTHFAYNRLGGLERVLDRHATDTYNNISEIDQPLVKSLLVALVRPGIANEYTRKRVRRDDLVSEKNQIRLGLVLQRLTDTRGRLLTEMQIGDDLYLELTHEILLRQWSFLHELVEARKERIEERERLLATAELWLPTVATRGKLGDPSYLYRGSTLKRVHRFIEDTRFTDDVDGRIAACYAASQQYQRNMRLRVASLSLVGATLLAILVFFGLAQINAEQARTVAAQQTADANATAQTIAEAERATAAAQALIEQERAVAEANRRRSLTIARDAQVAAARGEQPLALALALEANNIAEPPLQAQAILAELAYKPDLVRELGPGDAVSLDGSKIVDIVTDGTLTVILRDLTTGSTRTLGNLSGLELSQEGRAAYAYISSNNRYVFAGAENGIIGWDTEQGIEIVRMDSNTRIERGFGDYAGCIVFGQEGLYFTTVGRNPVLIAPYKFPVTITQFESSGASSSSLTCTAVSPDGSLVVSGWTATAPFSGVIVNSELKVWNIHTGELIADLPDYGGGFAFDLYNQQFAPINFRIVYGAKDNSLRIYRINLGSLDKQWFASEELRLQGTGPVIWSPDSSVIVANSANGVGAWAVETGTQVLQFPGSINPIWFNDNGLTIIAQSSRGLLEYELGNGAVIHGSPLPSGESRVFGTEDLKSSINVHRVAILNGAPDDADVEIINASTGDTELFKSILPAIISEDGRYTLINAYYPFTAPSSEYYHIVDLETMATIRSFGDGDKIEGYSPHNAYILPAISSNGSQVLLPVMKDNNLAVALWDVRQGTPSRLMIGDLEDLSMLYFSLDNRFGVGIIEQTSSNTATTDRAIIVAWDLLSGEELYRLDIGVKDQEISASDEIAFPIDFSPDGSHFASAYALETIGTEIALFDTASGTMIWKAAASGRHVAFSPDGKTIASGGDEDVRLLQADTGAEIQRLVGAAGPVAYSPNSQHLVTGASTDGTLRVWDVSTGTEIRRYDNFEKVTSVAFGPNGKTIFTASSQVRGWREWRLDTLDELIAWTRANRTVAELSPELLARYDVAGAATPVRTPGTSAAQALPGVTATGTNTNRTATSNPVDTPTAAAENLRETPAVVFTPTSVVQPGPLTPIRIQASGTAPDGRDSSGNVITYVAENMLDGLPDTTWRVAGTGVNTSIVIEFAAPVRLSEISLLPGYAKIDPVDGTDRFQQNRRIRSVRFEFSDSTSVEASYEDRPNLQPISVNNIVTTSVRIVIIETTEPETNAPRDFAAISELVFLGLPQEP